eukprot:gnl/Spiro4/15636_TR8405_c0_g1_i1.p1 gnl/Spiro4/15636_TR8405_c0_g1~~gnl/Spiro4/15636_TR8405_c0_g1_i1.p1  ORF type:complete len:141 (+),score=32.70 gnl/Spiro4/15636_TR8405_c0_g1_i1:45-425(+)
MKAVLLILAICCAAILARSTRRRRLFTSKSESSKSEGHHTSYVRVETFVCCPYHSPSDIGMEMLLDKAKFVDSEKDCAKYLEKLQQEDEELYTDVVAVSAGKLTYLVTGFNTRSALANPKDFCDVD